MRRLLFMVLPLAAGSCISGAGGSGSGSSAALQPASSPRHAEAPVSPPVSPAVLDGATPLLGSPAQPASAQNSGESSAPRVGATLIFTWIYPKADTRTLPLGYLRPGDTLALTDPEPLAGHGCA